MRAVLVVLTLLAVPAAVTADPARPPTRARALHDQGIAAYRAGHYQVAVRKLAAAYDNRPSPDLVYHLAQAYRRDGQWANAIDLYEKYLEIAPNGPASADCHAQLDRLAQLP